MATRSFSWDSFFTRFFFAFVLVAATFNPSGWSYGHWVIDGIDIDLPLKAFLGVILLIGWVIFLRATLRSLGPVGMLLVAALAGSFVWVLWDYGLLGAEDAGVLAWIGLVVLALILGVGMSWSHVRRKMSGQVDADDVDQD